MKSKKFRKKLSLNKKTVADLNTGAMKRVRGGDYSVQPPCFDPGPTGDVTCATCLTYCATCDNTCTCESACVTSPCQYCPVP